VTTTLWMKPRQVEIEVNESPEEIFVERGDSLYVVPPGGALIEQDGMVVVVNHVHGSGLFTEVEPRDEVPVACEVGPIPADERITRALRFLRALQGDPNAEQSWRSTVSRSIRELTRSA
jgi:hypothetical protein